MWHFPPSFPRLANTLTFFDDESHAHTDLSAVANSVPLNDISHRGAELCGKPSKIITGAQNRVLVLRWTTADQEAGSRMRGRRERGCLSVLLDS